MAGQKKTKKLINAPDDVISELIDGMVGAHPDLLRIAGETGRAIVAVNGPRSGKVGLVVGGGSGHEPLFSGYVGRGLADACAVGNVFASPSPRQIADAARAADGGAGVLFLYGNYTGDVMNFDMATEALADEGIDARTVRVTDDVASASADRTSERRGIAGAMLVFKIAGAAADVGHDMKEVERVARHANARTASMGVALAPCSLPQTAVPNFEIGDNEMEIGMGIHGEPGIARVPLETADAVVDRLLDPIVADLALVAGDRVAVVVNGLGATSTMELYILHRRVRQILSARGILLHRNWIGDYATSLEMAGASITLMALDDELIELLDHPCRSVALTIDGSAASTGGRTMPDRAPVAHPIESSMETGFTGTNDLETAGRITPKIFRSMMRAGAEAIAAQAAHLSELDGVIGDGDHGGTMDTGWRANMTVIDALPVTATVSDMCRAMSAAFLDAVGATAGPLYATAFLRAADAVSDRRNLDASALAGWIEALADGIAERGGAKAGDKTMMDAWRPAAVAIRAAAAAGRPEAECLTSAAADARQGAEATAEMIALLGRAAKLATRSVGHVDAGAVSAAIMLCAWADALEEDGTNSVQ